MRRTWIVHRVAGRLVAALVLVSLLAACGRDDAVPSKAVADMSVAELESLAAAGRADAIGQLGQRYYFGNGVERAIGRAGDLFRRGAQAGDVGSMHNYAAMLQHGEGMPKDEASAFSWFLRAAEGGHRQSPRFVGLMYKLGIGTEANHAEALRWFLKAAEAGDEKVYGSLADLYYRGEGIPQDYAAARDWWLKAARTGDEIAYGRLAMFYQDGLGVEPDPVEARRWSDLFGQTQAGAEATEAVLADWLATDPEIVYGFGLYLERTGRSEAAVEAMRRAAAANSQNAAAWLRQRGESR